MSGLKDIAIRSLHSVHPDRRNCSAENILYHLSPGGGEGDGAPANKKVLKVTAMVGS
jgi:hypothetical protein